MESQGGQWRTEGQTTAQLCYWLEQADWIYWACDLVLKSSHSMTFFSLSSHQNSCPLHLEIDCTCSFLPFLYWVSLLKAILWEKRENNFHLPLPSVTHQLLTVNLSKAAKSTSNCSSITCTPQCSYRVGVHTELNPLADRYMWGVGLHAACIRVPVGGVECLRQASSSSDPLPTGMGEAASSWDFTLLLSVWLQMLPLPTGCFPACAPHRYDRWRTNMRDPQLIEG